MELYFSTAHIPDVERVTIASLYLVANAKLWSRTRLTDDNLPKIVDWEELKAGLN
jgi:hypothetical protein